MDELLNPWKRDFPGSIQRTTDWVALGTTTRGLEGTDAALPAGTPVNAFANLDPSNPANNLCPDFVENGGHYVGALLSPQDKRALRAGRGPHAAARGDEPRRFRATAGM